MSNPFNTTSHEVATYCAFFSELEDGGTLSAGAVGRLLASKRFGKEATTQQQVTATKAAEFLASLFVKHLLPKPDAEEFVFLTAPFTYPTKVGDEDVTLAMPVKKWHAYR